MPKQQLAVILVEFMQREDGRIYVSSPDLTGLHIVGDDLALLKRDIPMIIKDMFYHGYNLIAEVTFAPSLEETLRAFSHKLPSAHSERITHTEAVFAEFKQAA